eukprot:TRINITY_DN2236_c0_g1_i1.p1 TRINITY_DN2236_c0_g1~~TRINITY_DN2236_c0_g1_i1.p1  ORF type:complete len:503 (+),score=102.63 TRINITY_DN2236_c0_g1_i1:70-1509(+)
MTGGRADPVHPDKRALRLAQGHLEIAIRVLDRGLKGEPFVDPRQSAAGAGGGTGVPSSAPAAPSPPPAEVPPPPPAPAAAPAGREQRQRRRRNSVTAHHPGARESVTNAALRARSPPRHRFAQPPPAPAPKAARQGLGRQRSISPGKGREGDRPPLRAPHRARPAGRPSEANVAPTHGGGAVRSGSAVLPNGARRPPGGPQPGRGLSPPRGAARQPERGGAESHAEVHADPHPAEGSDGSPLPPTPPPRLTREPQRVWRPRSASIDGAHRPTSPWPSARVEGDCGLPPPPPSEDPRPLSPADPPPAVTRHVPIRKRSKDEPLRPLDRGHPAAEAPAAEAITPLLAPPESGADRGRGPPALENSPATLPAAAATVASCSPLLATARSLDNPFESPAGGSGGFWGPPPGHDSNASSPSSSPQGRPRPKFKVPGLSLGIVQEKKSSDESFTYEKYVQQVTGELDLRAEVLVGAAAVQAERGH